jgi:hypothetical protein
MSYVIVTWEWGKPRAITANSKTNQFELITLDSDSAINRIFSHPYRAGAQQILEWINKHDESLSCKNLQIHDESQFRK